MTPPVDSPKQVYDAVYRELTAARAKIERLEAENTALKDDLKTQRMLYWHEHAKFERLMSDIEQLREKVKQLEYKP